MQDATALNDAYIKRLITLAEHYDQQGLYNYADKVYAYLQRYSTSLPADIKMRASRTKTPQSEMGMLQYERGLGAIQLKGHAPAYMSGKGQAAFRENGGLATNFA